MPYILRGGSFQRKTAQQMAGCERFMVCMSSVGLSVSRKYVFNIYRYGVNIYLRITVTVFNLPSTIKYSIKLNIFKLNISVLIKY